LFCVKKMRRNATIGLMRHEDRKMERRSVRKNIDRGWRGCPACGRLRKAGFMAGFTLVELVVAIVIVGVLAALALPRFSELGSSARAAAVNSFASSLTSALKLAYAECMVSTNTCEPGWAANHNPIPTITTEGGATVNMMWGYPWGRPNNQGGVGLLIDTTGFTETGGTGPWPTTTQFTKDLAPDPTNCAVRYVESTVAGVPPTVNAITSGC
jgi:MSHA pilin protein MshA